MLLSNIQNYQFSDYLNRLLGFSACCQYPLSDDDLRFGLLNNNPEYPDFVFSYLLFEKEGIIYAEETKKNREDAQKLLGDLQGKLILSYKYN